VDWEGGVGSFLYDLTRRHDERELEPGRVLRERWEEIQFAEIQGDYRRYREILSDSLATWCEERSYHWNERDGEALMHSMQSWQPFPDTVPALRRAQAAGLRLAIISNTDRSIIEHTLRQLEIDFDEVVVAEDAGAYKPSRQPFELALDRLGVAPDEVLHVAFGFKYDIGPAQELGFGTAWVNRHQEPAPGSERPDHEWRDLWGLAELAESAAEQ
jgi:2-haloacid dehalogenase